MKKPTILIIEQNPRQLAEIVQAFVRTGHYTVYSSRGHEGALQMLEPHRHRRVEPHVIITHFGGLVKPFRRFLQCVRKDLPNAKVILFSENPLISSDYDVDDIVHQSEPDGIEMLLRSSDLLAYLSAKAS